MRNARSAVASGLLVLLFVCAAAAEERPIIEVTPGKEQAFHVAVQTFRVELASLSAEGAPVVSEARVSERSAERARVLRSSVEAGLDFNGVLLPLSQAAFLGPQQTLSLDSRRRSDCSDWRQSGADALVEGAIRGAGAEIEVEYRVWDVARCVRLLSSTRVGLAAKLRSLGSELSDDVVKAFTGTRGSANTEIAFISTRTGRREVFVLNADGTNARPATNASAIKAFPEWMPDGGGVLYTTYLRGGVQDLFLSSRGQHRAGRIFRETLPGAAKYRGVFRPDGGEIAIVASVDGNAELFRVGRSGRGLVRLTNNSPVIDVSPTWSPDGEQIAFASDRAGSPQIYVMDRDGRKPKRITYQSSYSATPAWSPDGRWIAYGARTEGEFDLYLTDPLGEMTIPLVVHRGNDQSPSWSPDGRKIVFSSDRRGRADLYVIDINSGRLQRLTSQAHENLSPDWGPFKRQN